MYNRDMTPMELPDVGENRYIQHLAGRFYHVYGDSGAYIVDANGALFDWDFESAMYAAEPMLRATP